MAKVKQKEGVFTVVKAFRDSDEHIENGIVNYYNVGDDVSHFDEARLEALKVRNLVKGETPKLEE